MKKAKSKRERGRYSKVSRRMWNDGRVRALSWPAPNGLTLWQRFLTGPELGCIPGLFQGWEAGMAQALRWDVEGFREAFREVSQVGLAAADWRAGLVWVPKAIEHNRPESPNVVRSWRDQWEELPECPLKLEAYEGLKAFCEGLGEGFAKAFAEACRKPSVNPLANQEQEQEQEQEEISPSPQIARPRPPDPFGDSLRGRRPEDDPGVVAVFEAWKLAHGFEGSKFRQPSDHRAAVILEAVRTNGVAACLDVIEAAKTDDMVTGKADENGQEHRSIDYLFKPSTFDRLLRAATKAKSRKPLGALEITRRAREAKPGSVA